MRPTTMVPAKTRLAPIDVLRGFTILSVVAYHFHADTSGVIGPSYGVAARAAFWSGRFGDALEPVARTIVAQPGFRLDLLLLVTGLVLSMGQPISAATFLRRRARAVLPNYVFGSIAAALVLAAFAALRSMLASTPFEGELASGTLLGRRYYPFAWTDLLRSLSIVGRLESPRAMQVVAPSLWYLVLIGQLYLVYPWLRRALDRLGPIRFLAGCAAVTLVSRWIAFGYAPFGAYDGNAAVIHFLPPRLIDPALGMVAARVAARWTQPIGWRVALVLAVPAGVAFLEATWMAATANMPGSVASLIGPSVPLVFGLPALWLLCDLVVRVAPLARVMTWIGQRSLSLLVAQDFVRLGVGTLIVRGVRVQDVFWEALPAYLAVAVLVTWLWHPVPEWCWRRLFGRSAPRPGAEILPSQSVASGAS